MGGPVSLPPLGRLPAASVEESQTIVDRELPRSLLGRSGPENGHEHARPDPLSGGPEAFGAEMTGEASTGQVGGDHRRSLDVPSDEVHVREVFAEYLAARRQCGESTANLTLEKFRAKLDANRQQLIAKYGCRTARFSVYIKDGKAGIKATPLRD
jgi:hypothetical protein